MALSGLEIYKLLPKTNCKDCGFPTCLAFAMKVATKQVGLEKCPHVTAAAAAALESASRPPIQLVVIGAGDAAYLALAGVVNLVVFLPALVIVSATGVAGAGGLAWLAASFFGVYLCARLLTLGWRVRGTAWQRVGAH